MTDNGISAGSVPQRLRRALEIVYQLEGVAGARVWQWGDKVALGVRPTASTNPSDLLRRIDMALAAVRDPQETWELGVLEEDRLAEEPESPPAVDLDG
jgi:hypothetical protein